MKLCDENLEGFSSFVRLYSQLPRLFTKSKSYLPSCAGAGKPMLDFFQECIYKATDFNIEHNFEIFTNNYHSAECKMSIAEIKKRYELTSGLFIKGFSKNKKYDTDSMTEFNYNLALLGLGIKHTEASNKFKKYISDISNINFIDTGIMFEGNVYTKQDFI